jgi:hypothetical protein
MESFLSGHRISSGQPFVCELQYTGPERPEIPYRNMETGKRIIKPAVWELFR